MHGKLRYVSKCNKLVQLVVQVKYHVNVIYNLGGGHTQTYQRHGQKQFQETRCMPAFGWFKKNYVLQTWHSGHCINAYMYSNYHVGYYGTSN